MHSMLQKWSQEVPVLNHEISEGANDAALVNLESGSKSHCKNNDQAQALPHLLWQSLIFIHGGDHKKS